MRLLRFLPERWHRVISELAKFAAVGCINTAVDFLVFNLLLPVGPLKAKVGSTIVGTTVSYFINRHWTFSSRERTSVRREYALFFGLNLIGLAIQLAVLGAAKYGLHFSEHSDRLALNIANAVGIGIAMVFRFWSYRAFVFTNAVEAPAALAEAMESPVTLIAPTPRAEMDRQVLGTDPQADEFADLTASLTAEIDDAQRGSSAGTDSDIRAHR